MQPLGPYAGEGVLTGQTTCDDTGLATLASRHISNQRIVNRLPFHHMCTGEYKGGYREQDSVAPIQ